MPRPSLQPLLIWLTLYLAIVSVAVQPDFLFCTRLNKYVSHPTKIHFEHGKNTKNYLRLYNMSKPQFARHKPSNTFIFSRVQKCNPAIRFLYLYGNCSTDRKCQTLMETGLWYISAALWPNSSLQQRNTTLFLIFRINGITCFHDNLYDKLCRWQALMFSVVSLN